jgi:hypothetical protein
VRAPLYSTTGRVPRVNYVDCRVFCSPLGSCFSSFGRKPVMHIICSRKEK